MNNKLVTSNLYLMHKKTRDQAYLNELARRKAESDNAKNRGARISSANQATSERFAREAQAAQSRIPTQNTAPAKGYGTSGYSPTPSTDDRYRRAAAASEADLERTARRKADQERINAANRQASEGRSGSSNKTGVDWSDPNSPSYKAWKKAYNTEYYKNNADYWEMRYRAAHPMGGRHLSTTGTQYEGASRSTRNVEVKGGSEAMRKKNASRAAEQGVYDWARGEASRGMHGSTSQAQAALARSARDTSVSTNYGTKSKLKDLGHEIINSGKNYVSNYADGARQIKELWSSGAQSIASNGKKLLDKIMSKK